MEQLPRGEFGSTFHKQPPLLPFKTILFTAWRPEARQRFLCGQEISRLIANTGITHIFRDDESLTVRRFCYSHSPGEGTRPYPVEEDITLQIAAPEQSEASGALIATRCEYRRGFPGTHSVSFLIVPTDGGGFEINPLNDHEQPYEHTAALCRFRAALRFVDIFPKADGGTQRRLGSVIGDTL